MTANWRPEGLERMWLEGLADELWQLQSPEARGQFLAEQVDRGLRRASDFTRAEWDDVDSFLQETAPEFLRKLQEIPDDMLYAIVDAESEETAERLFVAYIEGDQ